MSVDLEITPTLEGFTQLALDAYAMGLRVGMPGTVEKYDAAKQLCSVQPSIKRKGTDGVVRLLPVINNVPVGHLRAGKAIVHMPVAAGHTVYLHFSDRSLDNWKSAGGNQDPNDPRTHDLSDAVAYPGFYPFSDILTIANPDALTLMHDKAVVELSADGTVKSFNDTAKMEMTPAGKFKFANDSQELLDLLDQTLQAILSATTNTIFGPQPFVNLADFAVIKAKLATLKE